MKQIKHPFQGHDTLAPIQPITLRQRRTLFNFSHAPNSYYSQFCTTITCMSTSATLVQWFKNTLTYSQHINKNYESVNKIILYKYKQICITITNRLIIQYCVSLDSSRLHHIFHCTCVTVRMLLHLSYWKCTTPVLCVTPVLYVTLALFFTLHMLLWYSVLHKHCCLSLRH